MKFINRLSSLLSLSSVTVIAFAMLSGGSTSCGTNHACFYFTDVEYDIGKSCPSRQNALAFFQGNTCSSPITSVDSDGEFDGSTCCYEVTENTDEFFTCGIDPGPPPFTSGTSVVSSSSGIGGTGGVGGTGGAGGSGGCAKCAEFLTNDNPPTLCAPSVPIYETYSDCLCNGPCASVCASACSMNMPSMECETCSIDTTNGCGAEHDACLSDN